MPTETDRYNAISDNIIELVLGKMPVILPAGELYRGDSFSFTIIGRQHSLAGDPYNFAQAKQFNSQVRFPIAQARVYGQFTPEEFVLGQTDAAIAYDTAQSNPAGTTFDELHIVNDNGEYFKPPASPVLWDVEMIDANDLIITLVRKEYEIIYDITRIPS